MTISHLDPSDVPTYDERPRCYDCAAWIDDDTTAKQDLHGRWFCASCCAEIDAENVPQDWTERELVKVNYTPRKLNWSW